MSHRTRTRLRCHHDYRERDGRAANTLIDPQAQTLTRYEQCRACGHKRRFAPPSQEGEEYVRTAREGGRWR